MGVAAAVGVLGVVPVEGVKKDSSFGDEDGGEEREAPFGEGDDDMVNRPLLVLLHTACRLNSFFRESNPRKNSCYWSCGGNLDPLAIAKRACPLPASW